MLNYHVQPGMIQGEVIVPPSKSHTLRAILLASFASGDSLISHYLHSPDTQAMIQACRQLGAHITETPHTLSIRGVAGKPALPDDVINAGNSGQVLRFVAAMAAMLDAYTIFTGDHSIRFNRPADALLKALTDLGAECISIKEDGRAPFIIRGPIRSGVVHMQGEDSQPVSAMLLVAIFLEGKTEIHVENPGETPWIDLTLDWLKRLNISFEHNKTYTYYKITAQPVYAGFEYTVPGDFSAAAYPIAAALITQSSLTINNLQMNDLQGDKIIIPLLQQMAANITVDENKIEIHQSPRLKGMTIDMAACIDALPILAVIACFAEGETRLENAGIARKKESDRLMAIRKELSKMGAAIEETADSLLIRPQILHAARLQTYHDHRIAMALTVAAMAAKGESIIQDIRCIDKSYPNFLQSFQSIGANIVCSSCKV